MTGSQVTMEVHFQVEYWTTWGQNLVLVGSSDALGKWDATRSRQMVCHHEGDSTLVWALSVSIPAPCRIDYYYAVVDEDGKLVKKENVTRKLVLATAGNKAVVKDTWQVFLFLREHGLLEPCIVSSTSYTSICAGLCVYVANSPCIEINLGWILG